MPRPIFTLARCIAVVSGPSLLLALMLAGLNWHWLITLAAFGETLAGRAGYIRSLETEFWVLRNAQIGMDAIAVGVPIGESEVDPELQSLEDIGLYSLLAKQGFDPSYEMQYESALPKVLFGAGVVIAIVAGILVVYFRNGLLH